MVGVWRDTQVSPQQTVINGTNCPSRPTTCSATIIPCQAPHVPQLIKPLHVSREIGVPIPKSQIRAPGVIRFEGGQSTPKHSRRDRSEPSSGTESGTAVCGCQVPPHSPVQ